MNLYSILGLAPGASPDDIRRAYRRAAKAAHPDREGGSHEAMSVVNLAYAVLSDQTRRLKYDRTGDTDEEATLEDRAATLLKMIFSKVCEQALGDKGVDPIEVSRQLIAKDLGDAPQELERQRKKVARLKRALTKQLRRREIANPVLEQCFNVMIFMETMKLAEMEKCADAGPLMLDMLDNYTWQEEQEELPKVLRYWPYSGVS